MFLIHIYIFLFQTLETPDKSFKLYAPFKFALDVQKMENVLIDTFFFNLK